jgi:hypothetical protein
MRPLSHLPAEVHLDILHTARLGDLGINGSAFTMPCGAVELRILASTTGGWDHVSVSLPSRCPRWAEMEAVKRAFFADDEVAMQLHVAVADHVNDHPFVLHIWRPQHATIPLPPSSFV